MPKDKRGRLVLDARINKRGRGRLLAMGRLLPPDYDYVRVTVTRTATNSVWLHVRKLSLAEAD